MRNPALHELTSEAQLHRTITHECTQEEFESVARRIDGGLEWGVGAIITDTTDRVLLIREHDRWQTPGGEVEDGESHEAALRREVEEETGLQIDPGALVAVTENRYVCDGAPERGRDRESDGVRDRDENHDVTRGRDKNNSQERAFAFAHYTATLAGESMPGDGPVLAENPGLADESIEAVEWFSELPTDTLQADIIRTALE